jgi:hypothetical protein
MMNLNSTTARSAIGILGALWLAFGTAGVVSAQALQVDATLPMVNSIPFSNQVVVPVGNGVATVTIEARNLLSDAVVVDLTFQYSIPPGTIAFDELIEHIDIATESAIGEPFFASTIDAKLIPLNPNRVPLLYRVTLYRPTDAPSYQVHVQVFGNYE